MHPVRVDDRTELPVLVVLPGRAYGPDSPLLYYSIRVGECLGWDIVTVDWSEAREDSSAGLISHAASVVDRLGSARVRFVVGKSLGSLLAPAVSERRIPALWLTPLLNRTEVVDGVRAAVASTALVGGTADESWDDEVARATGLPLLVLPGGDHSLMVQTDVEASIRFHAEVAGMLGKMLTAACRP